MTDHKVLIAVPALDMMPVQTAYDMLTLTRPCPSKFSFIVRASCHDARNMLAAEAIESGADEVLWIDTDMTFGEDLLIRLGADLENGADLACGIFFKRELPPSPVIYKSIKPYEDEHRTEPYWDYPRDQVFPIAGCGFGAVMTKTSLLKAVTDAFGAPFALMPGLSEDLSFCARAELLGAKMVCDSRVKVGHVGQFTFGESLYRRPGG